MRFQFEPIELRTRDPFRIARMASVPVRRSVLVEITSSGGLRGRGEAAVTTPYYGETAETAMSVLPRLAAALEEASGNAILPAELAEDAMADVIGGNMAAKAGLSSALHDLHAAALGLPLWKLLGLAPRAVPSSYTIALDEIERMRERVREAGTYPILKIKIGTPDDEAVLRMIREEAPEKRIRVDANTGWSAEEALRALPLLEENQVELLEQPLHPDDLEGIARVNRRCRIPIVADESCRTAADIPRLAGLVDVVNIKLAKCGGIREALKMIDVARAHRMEVMLGCMIETTLGIAAAVQVSSLADYLDLDGAALIENDPFTGPGIDEFGAVRFNEEPGLGVSSSIP